MTPPGTLKDQINKRSGFASAHEEAYLNIMRTAAMLGGPESAYFRSLDPPLSPASYNLLRILRGHLDQTPDGQPTHGVRASEIGAQMVVRTPDVTRLVDRLERHGLAKRSRCPTDRRVVFVEITQRGLDLLARADGPVQTIVHDQLGHLRDDELETLSRLLEKARNEPTPGPDAGPDNSATAS